MAPPTLLGPPGLNQQSPAQKPAPATTDDAFMDLMIANFNTIGQREKPQNFNTTNLPPMVLTENLSPTFLSTGNPCLDFFFHVVPDTKPETLRHLLELAWKHDPLTTLKLVCNLRGVRGTGKSDKEGFYASALWLHQNHPKTLARNLRSFVDFGYLKDLPEILYRLIEGLSVRETAKHNRTVAAKSSKKRRKRKLIFNKTKGMKFRNRKKKEETKSTVPREERIAQEAQRMEMLKEKARQLRHENRAVMAKKAIDWYNHEPDYRYLHDQISEVFAELLTADIQYLNSGETRKISLAAKWCPSLESSFDRHTLLCEGIARRVFPRESHPEYEGIEEHHFAYRVRDRLRKEVLVPLRKALELPEIYISSNRWSSLPYERVPSVAMKTYKKLFFKHDEARFKEYLSKVTRGEAKIAAGALLPHEILASMNSEEGENEEDQVAELQWRRMVADLSKKGKLTNCLAVCDVSGSMNGIPMQVSVALGLLTSELSAEPWKGKLISFSHDPQLHSIQGDNLRAKMEFIRNMEWGMNTDFQKVFDLILQVGVEGNLSEEQMIKRVFVFSDMEFDQASLNPWETDYEVICRKFRESGYGKVPEIVFWNLRDSRATPVPGTQNGVALVSGYSKNLLTLFLDGGGIINPEAVMELAIAGPEYLKLVVLD